MSDGSDPAKKAAYEAWAERMRSKKQGDKQSTAEETPSAPSSGYWSAESLYRDSELSDEHAREEQQRQAHLNHLLAKLGLSPGSTLRDCSDRVKQLAREVHPDMNLDKSIRTGKVQLERMVEINAAYEELKRLLA